MRKVYIYLASLFSMVASFALTMVFDSVAKFQLSVEKAFAITLVIARLLTDVTCSFVLKVARVSVTVCYGFTSLVFALDHSKVRSYHA